MAKLNGIVCTRSMKCAIETPPQIELNQSLTIASGGLKSIRHTDPAWLDRDPQQYPEPPRRPHSAIQRPEEELGATNIATIRTASEVRRERERTGISDAEAAATGLHLF